MDERIKQARLLYERAVFTGETAPLAEADRHLDAAEAATSPQLRTATTTR